MAVSYTLRRASRVTDQKQQQLSFWATTPRSKFSQASSLLTDQRQGQTQKTRHQGSTVD